MAVLAPASALPHELSLRFRRGRDRFSVGHLRFADLRLDPVLAKQPLHQNLQMKLSHPGKNRLTRILVITNPEGRILVQQPRHGGAQGLLIGLGLGLYRYGNHRLRKHHGLEENGVIFRAERIPGVHLFQAHGRGYVPGIHRLDLLAIVGVHAQQAQHPLSSIRRGVVHPASRFQRPAVHPKVSKLADVRVTGDLEHQSGERPIRGRTQGTVVSRVGLNHGYGHRFRRRGQVIQHGIEQRLDPLVLESGAAEHRKKLPLDGRRPQHLLDSPRGKLLSIQVFF